MKTASGYDVFKSSGLFDEYMYRITKAQTVAEVETIVDETICAETHGDLLNLDRTRLNYIASIASRILMLREEVERLRKRTW